MYRLTIHHDAEGDLEQIRQEDLRAATFLLVLLEELEADQDLLDRLTQHGYQVRHSDDWAANLDVTQWVEQQRLGRNLWRLKTWEFDADGYRVVYAFQPRLLTYVVLGIFHRSRFDYGRDDAYTRRVVAAYQDLCSE